MSSPINYHWEDIKEDLVREAEARDRGQTRIEVSGRRDWDGPCVGFVEFHTNGPQGGDAGYGGFVRVAFTNTASTWLGLCLGGGSSQRPRLDDLMVEGTQRLSRYPREVTRAA
jgi:hypothetical protein